MRYFAAHFLLADSSGVQKEYVLLTLYKLSSLQPVLGWVLFNIYEGAKAQVDNMRLR